MELSIRRISLTKEEAEKICPKCKHTRACHHNPDDRCYKCGCGYYFYGK